MNKVMIAMCVGVLLGLCCGGAFADTVECWEYGGIVKCQTIKPGQIPQRIEELERPDWDTSGQVGPSFRPFS